jgi:hypothetical protein
MLMVAGASGPDARAARVSVDDGGGTAEGMVVVFVSTVADGRIVTRGIRRRKIVRIGWRRNLCLVRMLA